MNASIYEHLPDSSLGFPTSDFSSDILEILGKFLSNTIAPICGSRIHILLKRLPNENYTSTLMDTLRLNHVYVSVVTSTTPSGGLYQQTMYDIATRTNGICVFESDDWIHWTSPYITQLDTPYTIYSLNVGVAGSGNFSLPPIKSPCTTLFCDYFLLMTIQDHGPLDSFQTAKLTWQNIPNNSSDSLDNNTTYLKLSNGSLFVTTAMSLDANMSYSMNLDYDYSDTRYQILQIRVLDVVPFNHWLPYD